MILQRQMRLFLAAYSLLAAFSVVSAATEKELVKYEGCFSFHIKAWKDSYDLCEPARLVFAIANHRPEATCIDMSEPYIEIKDANGTRIRGALLPDSNTPVPAHYYMERDGKKIYTVPVRKIEGPGVMLGMIPNAFKRYHRNLLEGKHFLRGTVTIGLYEETSLIYREDFPEQLWVEAKGGLPQLRLESNTIEVQTRRRPPHREALPRAAVLTWPAFLIGAAAGVGAFYILMVLKKKASSRSK